jgi:arsenate reductase
MAEDKQQDPGAAQTQVVVYEKRTCSTCRNLVRLLEAGGTSFERVEYLIDPIPRAKLADLVRKMGTRPHDLVRTSEPAFRALDRALETFTDDEVLDLLATQPELVQRPIVEKGDRAVVARPAERVAALLDSIGRAPASGTLPRHDA